MSDISKCEGKTCKLKYTCWRYLAPSSSHQSFIDGRVSESGAECKDYWEAKSKSQVKRLKIQTEVKQ